MAMKYVSAYMLSNLSGKASPSADDIKTILASVGSECDVVLAQKLVDEVKKAGKPLHEIVAAGREQLQGFGGSAAPAASGSAAPEQAAAAPAAAAVVEEEEEEMDFDLFD